MWTEWQAGSRGPGLGRWLHFRAARGRSVIVAGSAALAGQDRRLEVSAPVEVRTAAYHSPTALHRNLQAHDPDSPLLWGQIGPEDVVRDRAMASCKIQQTSFFDE